VGRAQRPREALLTAAIDGVMLRQARKQGAPIEQWLKILWRG
jgi:hypothetical protein